ncbi:arylesterase [Erythrobacter pelagi]|uniref:Arylesterase n=1 Tax=Qipengyuania pelagi TaxID=994320 RepID=A0A844Y494_9SPHN|nr:arylesterase [Qipengyuania pelagi]
MPLLIALAACGQSADPAPQPRETAPVAANDDTPQIPVSGPERRILAFGDSLFAGYGVGTENSYPAKLETALRARGIDARIVNAGVSGDTSGAGRQRLPFVLDKQQNIDLVILELGGNDLLRGIPPSETRANFEAMLSELRDRGIPVLLMGMRAPPNYGPEFQRDFDALYGDLAQEYGADLIPFWLETVYQRPELFQNDRIHPTEEGLQVLANDTVAEVVEALPPAQ